VETERETVKVGITHAEGSLHAESEADGLERGGRTIKIKKFTYIPLVWAACQKESDMFVQS